MQGIPGVTKLRATSCEHTHTHTLPYIFISNYPIARENAIGLANTQEVNQRNSWQSTI